MQRASFGPPEGTHAISLSAGGRFGVEARPIDRLDVTVDALDSDRVRTLGGVLGNGTKDAIGAAADVLSGLGDLFKKAVGEAAAPPRAGPDDELDPLFERIDPAAGPKDPEFERLIDRLVETGLSEEEIASRFRAFKRRKGRR
jgi:hypothetical protein